MNDSASNTPLVPPRSPWAARRRRWLFRLMLLAGLVVLAEGASYFAYWSVDHKPFRYKRARKEMNELAPTDCSRPDTAPPPIRAPLETFHIEIHPYLGFSYVPDWPGKLLNMDPISDWGFTEKANRSPVRKRSPDKFIVGIVGASVAGIFSALGTEALERELKRSPQLSGKQIEFVNLAIGLYKQPQQLMSLNYVLAAGAEFDAVINIDGLNDIAWYRQDNGKAHVNHLYPIGWHSMVTDLPDPLRRRQVGKIAYLSDRRTSWAALFRHTPLRYSITANLIWKVRDRQMQAEIVDTDLALRKGYQHGLPYRARGPQNEFHNDDQMLQQLVTDWERCSLLLARQCKANGIRYYHFLQPNQYVPGSKPLSPEEQRMCYRPGLPARPLIEKGYPMLREAGQRLAKQGVSFHDLSMVFSKSPETLYYDNCCHFNQSGNEVMAGAIARALLETEEPPQMPASHTSLKPGPAVERRSRQ
jgi:hypothetical protein